MLKADPKVFDKLVNIGYEPEIVSLAIKDSKSKSMEEVLDLLSFKLKKYKKSIMKKNENKMKSQKGEGYEKPKSMKTVVKDVSSSDNENDEEEDNEFEEDKVVKKMDCGQNTEAMQEVSKVFAKQLDQELTKYITVISRDLKQAQFKHPSQYIAKLLADVEAIKLGKNKLDKALLECLQGPTIRREILELKSEVFSMLNKGFDINLKKHQDIKVNQIESLLILVFEMNMLTPSQMGAVILSYEDLLEKLGREKNIKFIRELNVYKSKGRALWKSISVSSEKKERKNNIGNNKEELKSGARTNKPEEVKSTDIGGKWASILEEEILPENMEECIICMEKTREIVFMPCCHFLTCPLCSPRVEKCPICDVRIENHLKIYWS